MTRRKSAGERILLELEPVAREAAQEAIAAETAKLSEWQQRHLVFGASLGERWAVFDWYIPGERQKHATVIVRASVDRDTNEVIVVTRPEPASRPKRTLALTAYAIVAPIVIAACFLLLAAVLDYLAGNGWPPIDKLRYAAPPIWVVSQLGVLALLYQILSSIPIRLPDGKLLFVNRVWLKKGQRREASNP